MPTWLVFIGTLVVQLIVAVFLYGQLTAQVRNHTERLDKMDTDSALQWAHLNDHERRISTMEGARAARAVGAGD